MKSRSCFYSGGSCMKCDVPLYAITWIPRAASRDTALCARPAAGAYRSQCSEFSVLRFPAPQSLTPVSQVSHSTQGSFVILSSGSLNKVISCFIHNT
eukprot:scaffold65824_cov69-Phaeocystis_antarctica.AAC.2